MPNSSKKRLVSSQRRRQLNRQKSKTIGRRQSQFLQENLLTSYRNTCH